MDIQSAGVLGLLYALVKLVEKLVDKREKAKQPSHYREDFLEKLGAVLEAQTHRIEASTAHFNQRLDSYDKIVLAVDPSTNYPRMWADSPQQKRTHDNVSNLIDIQEEMAKSVIEIHKAVKHG